MEQIFEAWQSQPGADMKGIQGDGRSGAAVPVASCLEPESVDDVDYAFLNENTSQLRSVLL